MSSIYNGNIKVTLFGESHGKAIGVVVDGVNAGELIDFDYISIQMRRRRPGKNSISTSRNELDEAKVVSGVLNGYTTGAPICALIENTDIRSQDYKNFENIIRPGHADYTSYIKYRGYNDLRGGGHLSGRLTAAMTFAGALCRQILEKRGMFIGAHIYSIGKVYDKGFCNGVDDDVLIRLSKSEFPLLDNTKKDNMIKEINYYKDMCDSIGGSIECAINNVPVGVGEPIFDGVESKMSSLMFAIPGVKGIEFGAGFKVVGMSGSENNDEYIVKNEKIYTNSNNHGGILGGISSGMPIIFRVAVKPTPSIGKEQCSLNIKTKKEELLLIRGRHDPCIAVRAVPVVESLASIAILDLMKGAGMI